MIDIPPALQAKLDAGVTTLARAWIVTRRDGRVFGFTDHDAPLAVAGVTCRPDSGFASGEMRAEAGFSAARGAVFGALKDGAIEAAELDAGIWDEAKVEIHAVDWTAPALRFRVFTGALGAVKRTERGYEAELEGLSARLDRVIGRRFSKRCDAELGDARCRADVSGAAFRAAASVVARPGAAAVVVSGAGQAPGWFDQGVLLWTGGANTGRKARIRVHRADAQGALIELEDAPADPVSPGDTAELVAGCDKRFETCRTKFANALNFRGCPHMPGNDVLIRHAGSEPVRDGRAR